MFTDSERAAFVGQAFLLAAAEGKGILCKRSGIIIPAAAVADLITADDYANAYCMAPTEGE